ncbi:hypothetical protein ACN3XK_34035, partial [Actinomadura welshii]
MTGDLRGQFLRQRAQLGARVDVQLLAGDVIGQDRIVVLRCGTLTLVRARPPVGAVATRPGRASSAVLRALRAAAALEGAVAVAGASLAPAFEPPSPGTPLVAPATAATAVAAVAAVAILETSLSLAATGLPSTRASLAARASAPSGARTAPGRRRPPLAALSATRSVEPAFAPLTARTGGTAFPAIVGPPLTGLGAPVVRPLERTARLA